MEGYGGHGRSCGGETSGDRAELVILGGQLFETGFLLGFDVVELVEGHGVDVYGVTAAFGGCVAHGAGDLRPCSFVFAFCDGWRLL